MINTGTTVTDNVTPFPPRLRVVPIEPMPALPMAQEFALIEYDGRMYDMAYLVEHLSPDEVRQISAALPRSGQEMWDEVVRRWPALAAEIVAGCDQ